MEETYPFSCKLSNTSIGYIRNFWKQVVTDFVAVAADDTIQSCYLEATRLEEEDHSNYLGEPNLPSSEVAGRLDQIFSTLKTIVTG